MKNAFLFITLILVTFLAIGCTRDNPDGTVTEISTSQAIDDYWNGRPTLELKEYKLLTGNVTADATIAEQNETIRAYNKIALKDQAAPDEGSGDTIMGILYGLTTLGAAYFGFDASKAKKLLVVSEGIATRSLDNLQKMQGSYQNIKEVFRDDESGALDKIKRAHRQGRVLVGAYKEDFKEHVNDIGEFKNLFQEIKGELNHHEKAETVNKSS